MGVTSKAISAWGRTGLSPHLIGFGPPSEKTISIQGGGDDGCSSWSIADATGDVNTENRLVLEATGERNSREGEVAKRPVREGGKLKKKLKKRGTKEVQNISGI